MIEQTDLIVKEWIYIPPADPSASGDKITSDITLEVMKKSASNKKGLACRFTCKFLSGKDTILLCVGEDSYVIDLADSVDRYEVIKMIRNSYSKFNEKFDLRKLGTILQDKRLPPLDEGSINIDAIVPLLN